MACLRLGSKSEAFHREGQTWLCTSGLPSDVTIEVGDMSFHLHKFPLLSRSGLLEELIEEFNSLHHEEPPSSSSSSFCTLQLHELPGGAKAFELVAKFCYGVRTELSAANVVALRCASDFLRMTEDVEEGNLVSVTEAFLDEVLASWPDSLKALESCDADHALLPAAEDLHIVSRCIDSLAAKAAAASNPTLALALPQTLDQNDTRSPKATTSAAPLWNGISSHPNSAPGPADAAGGCGEEWWFDDVSFLSLPLYKRLILAVEAKGAKPETISASIVHYARKYLPLMATQTSLSDFSYVNVPAGPTIPEAEQRALLEELVVLLPGEKGATASKTLLRLLRMAMMLQASHGCRDNLEKRVGAQLDQALLVDLLVPNMGYSAETLYDIDCVHRILDHFMAVDHDQEAAVVSEAANEGLTPVTMVANLVDGYLAEVAVDVNLKLPKFQALAAVIPDYARPVDDGIYNAIDVFLKAHPWLADSEREQLCRLMNCQKLSLEASTHAAQNERLPLRVIVQVLFFEQLRLRTSISGWFFVSSDTANANDASHNLLQLPPNKADSGLVVKADDDMRLRVSEIEKECSNMRKELQKLVKTKKKSSWSLLPRRFGFRKRPSSDHESKAMANRINAVAPESALEGKVENHHVNAEVAAH